MTPFTRLTGIAAAVPIANIDTDRIIPGQFLKTTVRAGLSKGLFYSLRQKPGFVLDQSPWNKASVIVALENFGCGSSREHAPWALTDFGIRCVIAPSIADIFYGNCLRNGILPIRLPRDVVDRLIAAASDPATAEFFIDLEAQIVRTADGQAIPFEIESAAKQALMNGDDEIALTERRAHAIDAFEAQRDRAEPWRATLPPLRFEAA